MKIALTNTKTNRFPPLTPRARPTLSGGAGGGSKILYVPVTRKVSPVDRTNQLPNDHVWF